MPAMYEAVLWDFGGVILSSPFEAFNRFELERGLPTDFLRTVNATDPHSNAWARLERSDITPDEFDEAFAPMRTQSVTGSAAPTCWPCWPAMFGPTWCARSTRSRQPATEPRA